jgi:glycosyltransferase involved in cell wall biosynthesis
MNPSLVRPEATPGSRNVPVSVAMAVFNGMCYLPEQMQSVLAELMPGDQLVVVDDHSSDGSWDWLLRLDDPRVTMMRNDRNLGVRLSFEKALTACHHSIVFLCDQDDIWLAGKRDALVRAFADDPDCMACLSDAEVIDSSGRLVAPSFMATRGGFKSSWGATLWKNRYLGCCMALRRPLVGLGLPIPSDVPMHDMWFGLLASRTGTVRYLAQPYIQYRRHGRNATAGRRASFKQMIRWRLHLWLSVSRRLRERRRAPLA